MKTKSFSSTGLKTFENNLNTLIDGDFSPNLAFVFSSVDMGIEHLIECLSNFPIKVAGVSSCGEIFYDGRNEGVLSGSVAVSMVEANPQHFATHLFDGSGKSSLQLGREIGEWGKQQYSNPSFVLTISGLNANGQEVVEGLQQIAGNDAMIFGGLAGDDARFVNTYVFDSKQMCNNGAMVVVFDSDFIKLDGIASSGWVSIGSDKVVTKAKGNQVFTIDNVPALKMYKEHLNIRDEDLPEIGVEYPLLVKKEGREILRAVIGINREDQSLVFAGTVPEGATVTFSTSPGIEVMDHTKDDLKSFFNTPSKARLLLLFSCMARHKALGPEIIEEIHEVYKLTGLPVTGFFTYGEIGNNGLMSCEFYNETFTLAVISERN